MLYCTVSRTTLRISFSLIHSLMHPSIFFFYPGLGHMCSSFSRKARTFLSPATSSSSPIRVWGGGVLVKTTPIQSCLCSAWLPLPYHSHFQGQLHFKTKQWLMAHSIHFLNSLLPCLLPPFHSRTLTILCDIFFPDGIISCPFAPV